MQHRRLPEGSEGGVPRRAAREEFERGGGGVQERVLGVRSRFVLLPERLRQPGEVQAE